MSDNQRTCPVCGMKIGQTAIHAEHLEVSYGFCSEQCRENFLLHPALYVGRQAVRGRQLMKHRMFLLRKPVPHDQQQALMRELQAMIGVQDIRIDGRRLYIDYNLLQVRAEQIERTLEKAGVAVDRGWWQRLKTRWIHYTEGNELDHLATDSAACCNRPPGKK